MGKKAERFFEVLIQKGGYHRVLEGLGNTVLIAISGLLIGILIGTLVAAVRVAPKYKKWVRALDSVANMYVAIFRGTPIVVQLLVFYFVLFPLFNAHITPVGVSILVFGLNSGSYVSEIMRSGIQSVDIGQTEGGRSVGLSYFATMYHIVIPQAVKNILPTLGNEFISLIKETSVCSFVGAVDLYNGFHTIGLNTYEFMVPYIAMALVYILLVLMITGLIRLMERRLKRSDRSHKLNQAFR